MELCQTISLGMHLLPATISRRALAPGYLRVRDSSAVQDPLAYFVTWTTYGTHLQGDQRGWRKRFKGEQEPQPLLDCWRRNRLKYDAVIILPNQRSTIEQAIRAHCEHRNWKLWAVSVRSNHIHVIVEAPEESGRKVRDQLKANATRAIRTVCGDLKDRPVWTLGGDWNCINDEISLERVILYVSEAQDRMGKK